MCKQPVLSTDNRAVANMAMHVECAVRMSLGGIGHLLDHAHFCGNGDPDAGLDYRTSAKMVMVWVKSRSVNLTEFPDA